MGKAKQTLKCKGSSRVERQSAAECGLCALRNVLLPHRDAGVKLPSWDFLEKEARALEGGEADLLEVDAADVEDRADGAGNFGVEVLMVAASRQRIEDEPLSLEYWGGRHREASSGRECGFILGSGEHWWCIRRCGRNLAQWEEADSLGRPIGNQWQTDANLYDFLGKSDDTVLVLYPSEDSAASESGEHAEHDEFGESKEYMLVGITDDGFTSLMDEEGEQCDIREDLCLPASCTTSAAEVARHLEDGEELRAVVRVARQPGKKDVILSVDVVQSG